MSMSMSMIGVCKLPTATSCVCLCMGFCHVLLFIGQIDNCKSHFNSEEVQCVVVDCSKWIFYCHRTKKMLNLKCDYHLFFLPFFALECLFAVNSVSV